MKEIFDQEAENFLSKLIEVPGVAGNTQEVVSVLKNHLNYPHIKILPDKEGLGFFQAVIHPDKKYRVLLASHMDTVGMRVSYIDENGFCFFRAVGGIDVQGIKGQCVKIVTRKGLIRGLVECQPIHHMTQEERQKPLAIEQFFIRTENTGKKDSSIQVGDPISFDQPLKKMGNDYLMGPGFDNRLGTLIMAEILHKIDHQKLNCCLYGVASPGEEIGCRGIRALTQKISPNLAIVIDVTGITDYPMANFIKFGKQELGKGPVIARGYNTRTPYTDRLIETAEELGIPIQFRAEDITATDGRETDEAGVATLVIRVPGTLLHTAHDLVKRDDIHSTGKLIVEFLMRLPF